MNLYIHKYLKCVLVLMYTWNMAWAAVPDIIHYQAKTDAHWHHNKSKQMCTLSLSIDDYGVARFVASPAMQPEFSFQARKDMHASGPIDVAKFAPAWHPEYAMREPLGQLTHIEGGGGFARGELSAHMLMALRQGMHLELAAAGWFESKSQLVVNISAKDLRPAMDSFLRCAHTDLNVSWQTISRTRVNYDVNQFSLNDVGRAQLSNLVSYVSQDPTIQNIYIDGHTDDSGTKKKNLRLAKKRAEEVAAYLRSQGVTSEKLVVRYHGAAYPVASNQTKRGKAKNRRTTVRLERGDSAAIAQQ